MVAGTLHNRLGIAHGRQCNCLIPNNCSLYIQSEIFCTRDSSRNSNLLVMSSFKPSLSRAWRRTFWHVYDNLGLLLIANTVWLVLAFTIVLKPAASMAMFYTAYLIVNNRSVRIKHFFIGLRKYFIKSTFNIFTLCAIWLLLIFNIKFYLGHFGIIGTILAGISFWLLIFSLMSLLYIYPLLCRGKNIKYSFILVIDNFKASSLLLFYSLILMVLELLAPILGIGILAIFIQNAFLEIEKQYNPRLEITEPKRRFREILKPWEFS